MIAVATQNFRSVDRLLAAPSASAALQVQTLGHDSARAFLRYQVAEQNRFYFENWEQIQLALGTLLIVILMLGSAGRSAVWACLLMLLAVAVMHWSLTPQIVQLGRAIDFVSTAAVSEERVRFWHYHTTYSVLELIKLALGLILAGILLFGGRGRRSKFRNKIDLVDHADHGHING